MLIFDDVLMSFISLLNLNTMQTSILLCCFSTVSPLPESNFSFHCAIIHRPTSHFQFQWVTHVLWIKKNQRPLFADICRIWLYDSGRMYFFFLVLSTIVVMHTHVTFLSACKHVPSQWNSYYIYGGEWYFLFSHIDAWLLRCTVLLFLGLMSGGGGVKPKLFLTWSWGWTYRPVPTLLPIPPSASVNPLLHPRADPSAGLDVVLIAHGFIFKLNPLSGAFRGQCFIVRIGVGACECVRAPTSFFNPSKACHATLMKWTNTRWVFV